MQRHRFLSKTCHKEKERKREKRLTPGWTDISAPGPVSFLSCCSIYYSMLILHNPISPLNLISIVFLEHLILDFLLRTNDLRRLQLTRIKDSHKKFICFPFPFFKRKYIRLFSFEFADKKITKELWSMSWSLKNGYLARAGEQNII